MKNTKNRRLIVLLIITGWVTWQLWIAWKDVAYYRAHQLPIEDTIKLAIAMNFMLFCIPAVLLGGILVWWFGQENKK
jgi:hypothetical protein